MIAAMMSATKVIATGAGQPPSRTTSTSPPAGAAQQLARREQQEGGSDEVRHPLDADVPPGGQADQRPDHRQQHREHDQEGVVHSPTPSMASTSSPATSYTRFTSTAA